MQKTCYKHAKKPAASDETSRQDPSLYSCDNHCGEIDLFPVIRFVWIDTNVWYMNVSFEVLWECFWRVQALSDLCSNLIRPVSVTELCQSPKQRLARQSRVVLFSSFVCKLYVGYRFVRIKVRPSLIDSGKSLNAGIVRNPSQHTLYRRILCYVEQLIPQEQRVSVLQIKDLGFLERNKSEGNTKHVRQDLSHLNRL